MDSTHPLEATHSCFGPELPYGLPPVSTRTRPRSRYHIKKAWTMVLLSLTAFALLSNYMERHAGSSQSSDHWTITFYITAILAVGMFFAGIGEARRARQRKRAVRRRQHD
jgi:hypothetical protein